MYAYKIDEFEKCVRDYFAAYFTAWEISKIKSQLDFAYKNPEDRPNFLDYTPQRLVNQVLSRPVAYNTPYPYVDTNPVGHIGDYSRRKYTYFDAFYLAQCKEKPVLTVVDKEAMVEVDITSFPELVSKRKHVDFWKLTYHESELPNLPNDAVFEAGDPTYGDRVRHKSGRWLKMNVIRVKIPITGNPAIFHSIYNSNSWKYNIKPLPSLSEYYNSLSTVNDFINNGSEFMKYGIPMYGLMFLPIYTTPSNISDNELENIKLTISKRIDDINTLMILYKPYYDSVKDSTTAELLSFFSKAYAEAENSIMAEKLRKEREKDILKRLNGW